MMNKFGVNGFGLPAKVSGISKPMNASITRLGKVIQANPEFPNGFSRAFETFAKIRPRAPFYGSVPRVPGSGYDSSGINPGGGPLPISPFV